MALYDHIQELRAELSASCNSREARQIKRELDAAMAQQAKLDAALNAAMATAS